VTAGRSLLRRALRLRQALRSLTARSHRVLLRRGRVPVVPRVLFYAADDLSDQYLRRVGRAVSTVPHDAWFATLHLGDPVDWRPRRASVRWAPYQWWDLVVVANHAPLVFPRRTSMLGVLHGIVRSRPVAEGSYWYAPSKMLDAHGEPVFASLLDASDVSMHEGERFVPQLAGRIRVVGDLRADDVLAAASHGPPREQALVMSTWGPEALVPRHLEALAPALATAADALGLAVVVTSHPNLWAPQPHRRQRDHSSDLLHLRDLGFTVLLPDEDWAPSLASSRVVICDHTSLAANFALLDRAILPVEIPATMIGDETFTASLYAHVEPWAPDQDLGERLRDVLRAGLPPAVHRAATDRCDHRGHAGEQVVAAFAELLDDLRETRGQPGS
jgi:hypothetical protein